MRLLDMLQEQGIKDVQRYKLPLLAERLTSMPAEAAEQVGLTCVYRQTNRSTCKCRPRAATKHILLNMSCAVSASVVYLACPLHQAACHLVQVIHLLSQRKLSELQHPASWMLAVVSNVEQSWQFQGPTGSSDSAEQRRWEEHKWYIVHPRQDPRHCAWWHQHVPCVHVLRHRQ